MTKSGLQLVDLRQVDLQQIEPLLQEEIAEWEEVLHWDFSANAEQVRRYVGPRGLPGVALMDGTTVAGYGYTVLEEPKGLIGDVYLRRAWRETDSEMTVFKVLLDALTGTPGILRVESQLMLVAPHIARALERERFVRVFDRHMLSRDPATYLAPHNRAKLEQRFHFEEWHPMGRESLSQLIARSYERHVDGQINDQFTTEGGAGQFVRSLMEVGGCGQFFRPASFFAIDRQTGCLAGAILTSFVARDTAHITQICVVPEAQNSGLGRELLRRAMLAMAEGGASRVTLTVTTSNSRAVRFYRAAGFEEMRQFCAIVWDTASHMSNS